jgi:Phosphoesterase family/FG-GAP-like repeat
MSWTGFNWTDQHPRFLADITGDGRADIVGFGRDGVWTSLNSRGDGIMQIPRLVLRDFGENAGSWHVDRHPRVLGDVTGDGRADIVGFGDDGVHVPLSNGDGSFSLAAGIADFGVNQGWRVDQHPRFLADVTGDGRADIVGFGIAGAYVALSNGDGSFSMADGIANFGVDQSWRVDQHPRFLADVTGDGRADIVGFGGDGVYVALSNGDGSFSLAAGIDNFGLDQGWRVDQHPRFLADVTGDGRADIVGFGGDGVYVGLSNADGTFSLAAGIADFGVDQGWRVDQHPRFLADVTGDGRADIVAIGGNGVYIALSNGDGTFSPAGGIFDFGLNQGWRIGKHPRFLADVTGDGRADIVGFADDGVRVSLGNGNGTFRPAQLVLPDYSVTSTVSLLKHVFVLMLENRSFDHMLGHSGIKGTDAETGAATAIDGLTGTESNSFHGETFVVSTGAKAKMPQDPGHSFDAQLIQLCGYDAKYPPGGPYPPVNNSGFATSYGLGEDRDPADVMRGYAEDDLPYPHQLAREFVVCDRWFASHPGHTWPSRVFVHAATSGGMDMEPSELQIINWSVNHFAGLKLAHGTIYDRLEDADLVKQFYAGDSFPWCRPSPASATRSMSEPSTRISKLICTASPWAAQEWSISSRTMTRGPDTSPTVRRNIPAPTSGTVTC